MGGDTKYSATINCTDKNGFKSVQVVLDQIRLLYGSMWVLWLLRWFLDGRRRRLRWRAQVPCMFAILAFFRCKRYSSRTGRISTPFFAGSIRSMGGLIENVSTPLASQFTSELPSPKRLASRRVHRGNGMWG